MIAIIKSAIRAVLFGFTSILVKVKRIFDYWTICKNGLILLEYNLSELNIFLTKI